MNKALRSAHRTVAFYSSYGEDVFLVISSKQYFLGTRRGFYLLKIIYFESTYYGE